MRVDATIARVARAVLLAVTLFVAAVIGISLVGVEVGPPELLVLLIGAVACGSFVAGLVSLDR